MADPVENNEIEAADVAATPEVAEAPTQAPSASLAASGAPTRRRVALSAHRVTLEGLEEGWTDECYALVTYAGIDELNTLKGMDEETIKAQADFTWVEFMKDIVLKHFVGGKIMVLDDNNQPVLDDMLPEDVTATLDILAYLFKAIAGQGNLDPKATAQAAPSADVPTSSSNDTATT